MKLSSVLTLLGCYAAFFGFALKANEPAGKENVGQDTLNGYEILMKSYLTLQGPGSFKIAMTKEKKGFLVASTIYSKRAETGEVYKRSDDEKIMKSIASSSTTLTMPDGQVWIIRGAVAIKAPDIGKDAALQKTLAGVRADAQAKVQEMSDKMGDDGKAKYLTEVFERDGKKMYRVIVIEPKIVAEILNKHIPEFAATATSLNTQRHDQKTQQDAIEMIRKRSASRREYVIDGETMLPRESNVYTEDRKKIETENLQSIERVPDLDASVFEVPKECKLLYPKNLKEYLSLLDQNRNVKRNIDKSK